jgi:hypothetical protein
MENPRSGFGPVQPTDTRSLGRGSSTTNLGHAARPADKSRINRRPCCPPPAIRAHDLDNAGKEAGVKFSRSILDMTNIRTRFIQCAPMARFTSGGRIGGQPIGQHTAGIAGPDHDVVEPRQHPSPPSPRSRPVAKPAKTSQPLGCEQPRQRRHPASARPRSPGVLPLVCRLARRCRQRSIGPSTDR